MKTKELLLNLIQMYEKNLSSEYALILNIEKESGEYYVYNDFLFGNINKNKVVMTRNDMSFGSNVTRKIKIGDSNWVNTFDSKDPTKLILVSKEFIYAFKIIETNELVKIEIDLSSTMFGKGTFYGYYIIEEISYNAFKIIARFARNKELNNFSGDFLTCVEKIFYLENSKEHPYQEFVDLYKSTYDKLILRSIEDILCEKTL